VFVGASSQASPQIDKLWFHGWGHRELQSRRGFTEGSGQGLDHVPSHHPSAAEPVTTEGHQPFQASWRQSRAADCPSVPVLFCVVPIERRGGEMPEMGGSVF